MTTVPFEARRFRSTAAYYSRYRVPYPAALLEGVAARVGLLPGDRVLDLGCGPAMLGLGFAPLFPALALLATAGLEPEERGAGVGVFSAFMDAGIAAGSVLGGVLIAALGSGAAIGVVALSQLGALALVLSVHPHRSSSRAGLETSIVVTEASETPPS